MDGYKTDTQYVKNNTKTHKNKTENLTFLTFCWPCIMRRFLVIVQLDAQIPFNIFIYSSLYVSSMSCSSSGETDCINTASGKCHSVLVAVSCAGWEKRFSFVKVSAPKLIIIQYCSRNLVTQNSNINNPKYMKLITSN